MKKIGYYAIAAFIAITGCKKEEFSGNGSIKGNYTLKVEIENGSDTRTAVDSENRVMWVENDQIGVWGNKGSVNTCFMYNGMSDDGSTASFKGTLKDDEQPVDAYYPYRMEASLIDDKLSFTLPSEYEYTECSNAPLIGVKQENGNFLFKHLCGLMKLTLKGVPAGASKLVIRSEGENAKGISGQAIVTDIKEENAILTISEEGLNTVAVNVDAKEISDKTFYIPLPVGEYSQISVSYITEDSVYFKKTISDCEIKRGVILNMPEVPILDSHDVLEGYIQTIQNYISTLIQNNEEDVEQIKNKLISWLEQQNYISDIEYDNNKEMIILTYTNNLRSSVSFVDVSYFFSSEEPTTKSFSETFYEGPTIYDVSSDKDETIAPNKEAILYIWGLKEPLLALKSHLAGLGSIKLNIEDEKDNTFYFNLIDSPISADIVESSRDLSIINDFENYSSVLISGTHGVETHKGAFRIATDEEVNSNPNIILEKHVLRDILILSLPPVPLNFLLYQYVSTPVYAILPEYFKEQQWNSTPFIYGNYCWSHYLGNYVNSSLCGYKYKSNANDNFRCSKKYFYYLFNGATHEEAVSNVEGYEFGNNFVELVSSDKHKKQRYFSITTNPVKHMDGVFGGVKVTGKFNGYNNLKKQGIQYGVFYRKKDNSEFIPSDPAVEFATFGEFAFPKPLDQEGNLALNIYDLDPETDYQFTLGFKYGEKYYYGNVCEFATGAEMDREALIDYYYQADGDNWDADARTNWCTDKPISEWANVSTSILDGNMRVTKLTFPEFSEKVENINLQRLDSLTTLEINGVHLKSLDVSELMRLKCIEDYSRSSSVNGTSSIDYVNLAGCKNYTNTSDSGLGIPFNYGKNTNLSGCVSLAGSFYIYEHMETLNLSGCTALEYINNTNNINLKELDVSGCSRLKEIDINQSNDRMALSKISLTGCTELKALYCNSCELTALDVSSCNKLEQLYCNDNRLTSLKLGELPLLYDLYCAGNQLASLDINQCKSLQTLSCGWNQLTTLNVSTFNELGRIYCDNNLLTSIEIPSNYSLGTLSCKNNKITTLDLSKMYSDQSSVEAQGNYITLVVLRSRIHKATNANGFTLWGEHSSSQKFYNSISYYYEYPQCQYAQ